MNRYEILSELPSLLIVLGEYTVKDAAKIEMTINRLIKERGIVLPITQPEPNRALTQKEMLSYRQYRYRVDTLTSLQPIHTLPNYEKRSFKEWHLDHKIPVFYGWSNNIKPEIIADISNLQMLSAKENIKKGRYLKK